MHFNMKVKYRIRKRMAGFTEQFYVDYKRYEDGDNLDDIPWMGGFYADSEDDARKIIEEHREYEELKRRLQMTEEIIYDETEEKHD